MKTLITIFSTALACTLWAQNNRRSDSLALVALYNATGGPQWTHHEQWLTGPLNTWYGVSLQEKTDRVRSLILYNNNLKGQLPNDLLQLDSVFNLVLANNELYGNIPEFHRIKNFSTVPRGMQLYTLRNNLYEFCDADNNEILYKKNLFFEFATNNFYTNALESKPLGQAIEKRLAQGASFSYSFSYKPTKHPIKFVWTNNYDTIITTKPELTINNFNAATQAGCWHCRVYWINDSVNIYYQKAYQTTQAIYLQKLQNTAPTLYLNGTTSKNSHSRTCAKNTEFPNIEIKATDDMNPLSLRYSLIYKPKHLQTILTNTETATTSLSPLNFGGSETIYAHFKRNDNNWVGTDSLVVKVTDAEGASDTATFYFISIPSTLYVQEPIIDISLISHKSTPSGTWLFLNKLEGIDSLTIATNITTSSDDHCDLLTSTDLPVQHLAFTDSVFIPNAIFVKNQETDIMFDISATNKSPWQASAQYYTHQYTANTKITIPLSNFKFTLFADNAYATMEALKAASPCVDSYWFFLETNGGIISKQRAFLNNTVYFTLKPGIKYKIYAKTEDELFTSDSLTVLLPRTAKETPRIAGKMQHQINCEVRIKKDSWVQNYYPPLQWQWGSSQQYAINETEDFFIIKPKTSNTLIDEHIPVSIIDSGGYRIDTSFFISEGGADRRPKNSKDTIRTTIGINWTTLNVTSSITDDITPDSLMVVSALKCRNIEIKKFGYKTIARSTSPLNQTDTLMLLVHDEACSPAVVTMLLSKDTAAIRKNKAPVIADTFFLANKLDTMPKKQFWFFDELVNNPITIDLHKYISDDDGFDNLTFYYREFGYAPYANGWALLELPDNKKIDSAFNINIENGILKIQPKLKTAFNYKKNGDYGPITSRAYFRLYAVDQFGQQAKTAYGTIRIANEYIDIPLEISFSKCFDEAVSIDVDSLLKSLNKKDTILIDYKIATNPESIEVNNTIDKHKITFTSPTEPMIYSGRMAGFSIWITWKNLYGGGSDFIRTIIYGYPCGSLPNLQAIPKQYFEKGQSKTINLWNYLQSPQVPQDYFWTIAPSNTFATQYDTETGKLTIAANDPKWIGLDSISVTLSNAATRSFTVKFACQVTEKQQITTQSIALHKGWNLISTNLRPTDSSIASLFKTLDVAEIKNDVAFWNKTNQAALNSLTHISAGQGYLVRMNSTGDLSLSGYPIQTPNIQTFNKTGWQLIGCPFQSSSSFDATFKNSSQQAIKNFDGFWKPNGSINSIHDFEPGKGYFLKK